MIEERHVRTLNQPHALPILNHPNLDSFHIHFGLQAVPDVAANKACSLKNKPPFESEAS